MGGNSQLYRLVALYPQGGEHHQQNHWKVSTLFSHVPGLGKLHGLATCKVLGTYDRGPRVHQAHQQGAVQRMEGLNT